ncbi:MAG: hypothetical protein JW959_01245 [Pirellulales bacterium]|nr:hypothetical protein [Pirellulales bacterium]
MRGLFSWRRGPRVLALGVVLLAGIGIAGCQGEYGGQTLPSPWYMKDDVQYYPSGSEFKLSQEAAAMKAYNQDQAQQALPR